MPWVKDIESQEPKIIYTAPPELFPMLRIIYNPSPVDDDQWTIQYAYIQDPSATLPEIEALMGL